MKKAILIKTAVVRNLSLYNKWGQEKENKDEMKMLSQTDILFRLQKYFAFLRFLKVIDISEMNF